MNDTELLQELCNRFDLYAFTDSTGCLTITDSMPAWNKDWKEYQNTQGQRIYIDHVNEWMGEAVLITPKEPK